MLNDLKTTITVIVGAIAYIVNKIFGIGIPENELVVVIVFILGLFTADSKKEK